MYEQVPAKGGAVELYAMLLPVCKVEAGLFCSLVLHDNELNLSTVVTCSNLFCNDFN